VKFSYNWICELVPELDAKPEELARLITMKTAECEGVEPYAPYLSEVVAARVLEAYKLEGTHLTRAIVDAGPLFGRKQVICGAPNCRVGITTAYVPEGVFLGTKEIRKAKIHGVESDGMLASGAELGINRDHDGILEFEAEPGEPVPGCTPDFVIEVDNKSLTHRPDLWGHHGMAREVGAITAQRTYDPADLSVLPALGNEWNVEIQDFDACPRYSALVFDNVKVGPSPLWLQARLEAIGLNPISNIVDVTNVLLAGFAQPMHAFDANKLHGKTIYVRHAGDGEVMEALNGESYTLNSSNLVIADAAGAVALAGVIGGAHSCIGPETTTIVLESACFEATGIRKTSAFHKLRTDASMRYEKAQDPVNTLRGLARAYVLLQQVCPGIRLVGGLVDCYKPAPAPKPIELPMVWLVKKLGRPIEAAEVRQILESLEFGVEESRAGVFSVTVPSWRATKDVTIKDDLLEEVGRMVGYASIPPVAPLQPVRRPWINEERIFHHHLRDICAAQGFTESYNYSFISEEMARRFGFEPSAHVRVANPISVEQGLMRRSLLPGIHKNLVDNARFRSEFRLFEIGKEIHPQAASELPHEIPHLMAAVHTKGDGQAALFELKRLAECLMPGCTTAPAEARMYEHPARVATITWRGVELARLFELHPALIESGRGAILDVDLEAMFKLGPAVKKYAPLRKYPSSEFDVSVVCGLRELCATVENAIRAAGCDQVSYLYSYRGKPLADDQQSMSFRVSVSAPDHTLSAEEVTAARTRILDSLRTAGYSIRG
jgi:phenylalanyl-tRNA synthetase beta chain